MENEIWKDVPRYAGIYQVSNLGRVKSFIEIHIKSNLLTILIQIEVIIMFQIFVG